jgi:uncharacterized membrane protein YgdD (TMEM256/DUF423 family)
MALLWRLGAVSCASSVGLGAIGAHKLKHQDEEWREIWRTASRYHQFGSVALVASAAVPSRRARWRSIANGTDLAWF